MRRGQRQGSQLQLPRCCWRSSANLLETLFPTALSLLTTYDFRRGAAAVRRWQGLGSSWLPHRLQGAVPGGQGLVQVVDPPHLSVPGPCKFSGSSHVQRRARRPEPWRLAPRCPSSRPDLRQPQRTLRTTYIISLQPAVFAASIVAVHHRPYHRIPPARPHSFDLAPEPIICRSPELSRHPRRPSFPLLPPPSSIAVVGHRLRPSLPPSLPPVGHGQ